jgi:uncharacterized protein (DUF1800 family)
VADLATRQDIARLFGRAAFGATGADHDRWVGKPYADAVDSLFPPAGSDPLARAVQADEAMRLYTANNYLNDVYGAGRWWLERMRTTPYPLEERMTFFWHDHFATAYTGDPDIASILQQNQTLRQYALGSFRDLANAMLVDPAMLVWLNGINNHVAGVNENLAREFFELFTLGTVPQVYTETDIRQAARVLTGWTVNPTLHSSAFTEARHDLTRKTVLGRSIGGWAAGDPRHATEYRELTEAALAHDHGKTVSQFLAYRLVLQFGYVPDVTNLAGDPLVQDVAWAIRAGDAWDLRKGVRTMLLHPKWRYADASAGRQLVRSPVEVAVHAAKVLGVPLDAAFGTFTTNEIVLQTAHAGQQPFLPPNVGGWPNGLGWLSQTTTLGRYDLLYVVWLAYLNQQRHQVAPPPPSADLAYWAWFMGLAGFSTSTTLRLREYLAAPGTTAELDKQAGMFVLAGSSPDWQVM